MERRPEDRKVLEVSTNKINFATGARPTTTSAGRGRRDPKRTTPQSRPHSSQAGFAANKPPPLHKQGSRQSNTDGQPAESISITQHQMNFPAPSGANRLPSPAPLQAKRRVGSAVARPYSAAVPHASALRPTSAKLNARPAPGARPGSNYSQGRGGARPSSVGHLGKPPSGAREETAGGGAPGLRQAVSPAEVSPNAFDEESAFEEARDEEEADAEALDAFAEDEPGPGTRAPPERAPRGAGDAGGFDFSTMEDMVEIGGARDARAPHTAPTAYGGAGAANRVVDRRTGRGLPRTGIAPDVYKQMVTWQGAPLDPRAVNHDARDERESRARFGFRSRALQLEVALTEKLRFVADDAARFEVMQQLFEETIAADANFGDILRVIKAAYDSRLDLLPQAEGDAVSLAAYQALEARLQGSQQQAEGLRNQLVQLSAQAADAAAARTLMQRTAALAEGTRQRGAVGSR